MESVKEENSLQHYWYDRWVMVNMKSSPVTEGDMRHNLLVLKRFRLLSEIWIKRYSCPCDGRQQSAGPNILPSEKAFAYRIDGSNESSGNIRGGISAKTLEKNANDNCKAGVSLYPAYLSDE